MGRIRVIKKRMGAVANIKRITKTMQMIATAKFTAALSKAAASKPYTAKIRQLVGEVSNAAGDVDHPLLGSPREKTNRELVLVLSSDRGLCGAFNGTVLRTALRKIQDLRNAGTDVVLETAGKKAVGFFRFQKIEIAERHMLGDKPTYEDVDRIASRFIDEFAAGTYDAVHVVYMRYVSNARQVPEVMQLLPLSREQLETTGETSAHANYEFSPSGEELLGSLLPLAVKTSLYQAFNDAVVSEQIMRMIAMKAATENAKDLGKFLKRKYNRARQSQITTDLMEVIAGSAALE